MTSIRSFTCTRDGQPASVPKCRLKAAGPPSWNISTSASGIRMSCSSPALPPDRHSTFTPCVPGSITISQRQQRATLARLHRAHHLPLEFENWAIHGQTTYIQQGYPPFHSPYLGPNSFTPWAQTRNTWTTSAFLGLKLWEGGELYYNPELLQGFGLHDTTGAAGFPNGEAQKSNFPYPQYSTSRLFLRQTIGLGGEQEKSRERLRPTGRQQRRIAADFLGRTIRGPRRFRHQFLRHGSARRFYELVDLGCRRFRLSRRQDRAHLWGEWPSSTRNIGPSASAIS